nr:MAG TPA: hypothetical protein [Caudoviricetes sp.]
MDVTELSREQLLELKQSLLESVVGHQPSWYECAYADDIVSDKQVYEEYGGTDFTPSDFFCTAM